MSTDRLTRLRQRVRMNGPSETLRYIFAGVGNIRLQNVGFECPDKVDADIAVTIAAISARPDQAATKASKVPVAEAGATQTLDPLLIPAAPSAVAVAARSCDANTRPAPPCSGRPASETLG